MLFIVRMFLISHESAKVTTQVYKPDVKRKLETTALVSSVTNPLLTRSFNHYNHNYVYSITVDGTRPGKCHEQLSLIYSEVSLWPSP